MQKLIQDSLFLEIYLIGYRKEGESIVFFVKGVKDVIYFTGVIDSFEYNNINKTIELLDESGIQHLDFLGWSHTDEDHSLGIDNLLDQNYVDIDTQIILPQNIHATKEVCGERVCNALDKLDEWITPRKGKKKYNVKFSSDYQLWNKDYYRNSENKFLFKLYSFAPNSTIVRSRDLGLSSKKNDYSLAFGLELGGLNFIFTGDIENYTINLFQDYYLPEKIEYLKIPHHSSKSSINLLKFFSPENKFDIACSTVSRGHNLPDSNVVQLYKDYSSEFYCTGHKNPEDEEKDLGIIKVRFDIIEKTYSVILEGNAVNYPPPTLR